MDLRTDSFAVDFSGSPGLNIQSVIGGFLIVVVDTEAGSQRVTACETAIDVLSGVLSFLDHPDLSFQWRDTTPVFKPNQSACIVARTETMYGLEAFLVTYAGPNPPHVQSLCFDAEATMRTVARWLGLNESAPETYEVPPGELDAPGTDGTLGA